MWKVNVRKRVVGRYENYSFSLSPTNQHEASITNRTETVTSSLKWFQLPFPPICILLTSKQPPCDAFTSYYDVIWAIHQKSSDHHNLNHHQQNHTKLTIISWFLKGASCRWMAQGENVTRDVPNSVLVCFKRCVGCMIHALFILRRTASACFCLCGSFLPQVIYYRNEILYLSFHENG